MVSTMQLRQAGGLELPVAGRYEIDPGHSTVGFEVRHLMLTRTRGVFHDFAGTVEIADNVRDSSVEVVIEAASIDTANTDRDEHLRSNDFLGLPEYAQITFRSRSVDTDSGRLQVLGDLTIRGVTRPVVLDAEFQGGLIDPWGGARIAFTAGTTINREDWGIAWNMPLDGGGLVVGREVRVFIEVEAVRAA